MSIARTPREAEGGREASWSVAAVYAGEALGVRIDGGVVSLVNAAGRAVLVVAAAAPGDPDVPGPSVVRPSGVTVSTVVAADATAALLLAADRDLTHAADGWVLTTSTGTVAAALGPAAVAVPVRLWPGVPAGPPLAAADGGPGALGTAAMAAAVHTPDAAVIGAARAAAWREGRDAERQASLMAEHGDDVGALVRRLVAVAHAGRLALDAVASGGAGAGGR